ncbi:hypothetical protein C5167_014639 [Papaver somniferum]|uniref:Uncharacterized protein n=1 Tax=Papaver somniferum TaxID=3469 RepID=A0A4Y7J7U1_PAPSO|nr:hypothetical protein C5167_014639 [Papaver somniferum]
MVWNSFIGMYLNPNTSNHLQKLKKMNPINVDTVLILMRNLFMNLSSPDFEDQASTYKCEQSMVPPSLQLAIRSNTLYMLIKQLRKQRRKGLNFTLYKQELSIELYIYSGSGHGDGPSNLHAMALLDANKGKPMQGIVEQVRDGSTDGSTIRVYLLPEFQFVQTFVAGIQSPSMGRRNGC